MKRALVCVSGILLSGCAGVEFHPEGLTDWSAPIISIPKPGPAGEIVSGHRFPDGSIGSGRLSAGWRQGKWSITHPGRGSEVCHFLNDDRHGTCEETAHSSGTVAKGSYVFGNKDGEWTYRRKDGTTTVGTWKEGKKLGRWQTRSASGALVDSSTHDGTSSEGGKSQFTVSNVARVKPRPPDEDEAQSATPTSGMTARSIAANCMDRYFETEVQKIVAEANRRRAETPGAGAVATTTEWAMTEAIELYESGQKRCGRDFSSAIAELRKVRAGART